MDARKKRLWVFILAGLALSVALALVVSPWASSSPDGLEKVAEDKGFLETAEENEPVWDESPIPDYAMPGMTVENEAGEEEPSRLATGLAGLVGTVAIFLVAWGLALVLKKKPGEEGERRSNPETMEA